MLPRKRPTFTILVAGIVIIGLIAWGYDWAFWAGLGIGVVVIALLLSERALSGWWAARDQRRRLDLSREEGRRCKGCNGDLWGLDVLPGKGGAYRVKCPECGVITEFKPGKRAKAPKPRKAQREAEDTRSFRIR